MTKPPIPDDATFGLTVLVRDPARSRAWYCDVLGAEGDYDGTDAGAEGPVARVIGIRLAGVRIWLAARGQGSQGATAASRTHGSSTIVLLTRRNLAELRRRLEERGATIDDVSDRDRFAVRDDGVRESIGRPADAASPFRAEFLWLDDPDGHRIELCRFVGLGREQSEVG